MNNGGFVFMRIIKFSIKPILFFIITCSASALYSQQQVPITVSNTAAYIALELNGASTVDKLTNILTTLTEEVRPILLENIDEEAKATKSLLKIHETLMGRFNCTFKEVCFFKDAFSESDLQANCNVLSLIYYSVLKDILKQPVVIVVRPAHAHIRWKFKDSYINWETTTGEPELDSYYEEWFGSNYSFEIDDEKGVLSLSYLDRGNSKNALKDTDGAIEDYSDAIEQNPKFVTAYNNRAVVKHNSGDIKGAIEDYNKVIEINIELNSEEAEVYYHRGTAKNDLGNLDGAIEDFSKAIELNPVYEDAYFVRGSDKYVLEDFYGAFEDYSIIIEINPSRADAYNNRGIVKHRLGSASGAIQDYSESIKLNPQHAETYFNRGVAKYDLGDVGGSIKDFSKAIELEPEYVDAYYNQGIAKNASGDKQGAIKDLLKAEELGDKDAGKKIKEIQGE